MIETKEDTMDQKKIGGFLKELRKDKGITRERLRSKGKGVQTETVSKKRRERIELRKTESRRKKDGTEYK